MGSAYQDRGGKMMTWVFDADEAAWIVAGLQNFWDGRLVSVAPRGFQAYGRLLHPARDQYDNVTRWADVARFNGRTLTPRSDFIHLALPRSPKGSVAWDGDPPQEGTLDEADAWHLIEGLSRYTTTPTLIWYGLWDGLGWDSAMTLSPGSQSIPAMDPVPEEVRDGPRIQIPGRDYLMYSGTLADALGWMPRKRQTPHLWWPADHQWCVAGDVDLPWTIVAGSVELMDHLVHDSHLEVMSVSPDDVLDQSPL